MAKLLIFLFDLGILFELLWGAHAWFTWNLDTEYAYAMAAKSLVFVVSVVYAKFFRININLTKRAAFAILIFFLASMIGHLGILAVVNFFVSYFPLYILICDWKRIDHHIRFVVVGLLIIFIPGLILHLIMLVKGSLLFGWPIQYPNMKIYTFLNYGFLLKGVANYEADGIRFQSIFLEPGYLGTMLAFLLYVLKYDMKPFANKILATALLLSMSLAGIVIMLLGYVICLYEKGKSIKKILLLLLVGVIAVLGGSIYNDGNNALNEKILSRFELDQKKGLSGNNRFSYTTNKYFDTFWRTGDLIWGIGSERVQKINGGGADDAAFSDQIRGAGYKIYFIYYGIVSAVVYMLFYFLLGRAYTKKMTVHMFGFWCIIVLTFVQASYPASFSWLIPYFMAISLQRKSGAEKEIK